MNPTAIYSKSGKGVQEASGKTSLLKRAERAVLSAIDGRATVAEVAQKVGKTFDRDFEALIAQLDKDGFVREVSAGAAPAGNKPAAPAAPARPASKPAATAPMDAATDLDFSSLTPAPPPRPAAPPPKPAAPAAAARDQQSALNKAREEAEARAAAERERQRAESEAKVRAEMEAQLRAEAEKKAREDASSKVKADAEAKLRAEAEAKIKAAREAAVKAAAEAKAKADAEARRIREEADKAKREADELKAKLEAERKAREEGERRAREDAERKAREEADRARREAEEKAERARKEAEAKAEQARREAEEARREAERARKEAEEKAERARKEAEEKAKREAEEMRRQLEEERRRLEEDRKRQAEELERKAEQERKAEAERAERRRREEEEEKARRAARDEEERKAEEEREARRRQREEEDRRAAEEERRAEEERAERRRQREEEERQEEEAREARRRAEQEERRKREEAEAEAQSRREADALALRAAQEAKAAGQARAPKKADSFADSLMSDLDSFTKSDPDAERKAAEEAKRKAREEAEQREREEEEREKRAAEERRRKRREEEEARERAEEEERERKRKEKEEARRREDEERARKEAEEKKRREDEEKEREKEKRQRAKAAKKSEDDITIGEDDLDMEDVQREQQALARAAKASGKPRESARVKLPPPVTGPSVRRKPVKWGKPVTITLLVLLLAGVGAAHVVPLPAEEYQRAASEALGRTVRLGGARLWLFGGAPQIRFENVSIGDAVKIANVHAFPTLGSLSGPKKVFNRIELDGLTLPQEAIAEALFARVRAENFVVERIVVRRMQVPGPLPLPKDLEADLQLDATGAARAVTVRGPDALVAKIAPKESTVDFEVTAGGFALPVAPDVTLSTFDMKGTADRNGMRIAEWGGQLLNGNVQGTANVRWGGSWVVDGVFTLRGINAAVFAPALLSEGRGEGTAKFTLNGDDPAKLAAAGRYEGNFTVNKGVLGSFDLSRALQTGGKQAAGRTPFNEMTGQAVVDRGGVALRNINISAGNMNAGASADIERTGALSGRIVADVRTPNQMLRATLNLGGTVREPQVRN